MNIIPEKQKPLSGKGKREKNDEKGKGKKKNEQMSVGEEDDDEEEEEVTCFLQGYLDIPLDESEIGQSFNLDKRDVLTNEYNPPLIYYDWLGDSVTTSHVCNQHEAFKTFHPFSTTVSGVGNVKIEAKGKGTVKLKSSYKGQKYIIELKDVLYIPTNRNNLISLGKWDKATGPYKGGQGELILIAKNGKSVTRGTKIRNNLYHMEVSIREPNIKYQVEAIPQSFVIKEAAQNWATWHKRFGHIGYGALQEMLDNNLIEGFNVDTHTSKPDCIACTEAKQFVEPYAQISHEKITENGDLTHIDVWGKYDTASIHSNKYFL